MSPQVYLRRLEPEFFDALVRALWAHDPHSGGRTPWTGVATICDRSFGYDMRFGLTARGSEWTELWVSTDGSYEVLEAAAGAGTRFDLFGPA